MRYDYYTLHIKHHTLRTAHNALPYPKILRLSLMIRVFHLGLNMRISLPFHVCCAQEYSPLCLQYVSSFNTATHLLKPFPKLCVGMAGRGHRLRIEFDKIGQKLSTIDLDGKHLLTTRLENGSAFFGRHSDQLLNALV